MCGAFDAVELVQNYGLYPPRMMYGVVCGLTAYRIKLQTVTVLWKHRLKLEWFISITYMVLFGVFLASIVSALFNLKGEIYIRASCQNVFGLFAWLIRTFVYC